MIVLNQVIIMALLILTGVICYKTNIISSEASKSLSSLVLMVVNPIVIIVSYQVDFDKRLLKGLLLSLLFSVISMAAAIILSIIFLRKKGERLPLERFSCIYSNCGFMGIPLVKGVYGAEGVFYLTAFMTVFNILVWTHGVFVMKGKFKGKMIVQAVKTPAVIATVLGFLLFILKISIPQTLFQTLSFLADMNTPLAMIAAGVTIAQTNILKSLKNVRLYLVSFVSLIAVPAVTSLILCFIPADSVVAGTVILASACPAAATGTLFAIRFKKDSFYASELFAVTTLLSIATLPVVMSIAQKLIN
ncbi:MAG: AEC family transporter [Oscillospiraceae bacterium]|nr:AEC family transporter [Oscillospiraceae bacterium]